MAMTERKTHNTGVLAAMIDARDAARAQSRLAAGGPPAPRPAPPRNPERAAAEAVAKAAHKVSRLPVFVESAVLDTVAPPELPELIPERSLLGALQSGSDAVGAMAICPAVVASVIEMQAMGKVTTRPPEPRRATRTDAALCSDFVSRLLLELGFAFQDLHAVTGFQGWHYASYVDNPRPLSLMLEEGAYQSLHLKLRLGGGGQRDGSILLVIPQGREVAGAVPALPREGAVAEDVPELRPNLRNVAQQAPVPLRAILARRQMSLGELRRLTPGSTISLTPGAVENVRLETGTGQLLALARLGEIEGCHALRLRPATAVLSPQGDDAPPMPAAIPAVSEPEGLAPLPEPPISDLDLPDAFRAGDMAAPLALDLGVG